jgi:NAD(P)-dependent dehydrogenase (short-subunit alcohol dehydrogenase family)
MDYLSKVFHLEDKVTVVTGGGGVLASVMAEGLLNAGAKVILVDINEQALQQKMDLLSNKERDVLALQCDVLDEDNLNEVNRIILEKYGRTDILVNAAGGNMTGATIGVKQNFFDLKIEEFRKVTDLNLNGTVLPTLVFAKSMAEHKSGSIINISSMAVHRAITRVVGYSAAKAGIDNFTRWLAVEMALKFDSFVSAITYSSLPTPPRCTALVSAPLHNGSPGSRRANKSG